MLLRRLSETGNQNVRSTRTGHSGLISRIPPEVGLACRSGPRGRKNMVPGAGDKGSRFKTTTTTRQEDSNHRLNIMTMSVSMELMEKRPGTTTRGITTNGQRGRHPQTPRTLWPLLTIGSMNGPEPRTQDHARQMPSDGISIYQASLLPLSVAGGFRLFQECRRASELAICGSCTSGSC